MYGHDINIWHLLMWFLEDEEIRNLNFDGVLPFGSSLRLMIYKYPESPQRKPTVTVDLDGEEIYWNSLDGFITEVHDHIASGPSYEEYCLNHGASNERQDL